MELIYLERYVLPLFYADLEKMVEPTSGSAPPTAGSLAMAGAGGGVGGEAGGHGALPGSWPGSGRAVGLAGGGVSAAQPARSGAGGAPSPSGSESGVGRPALVRAAPVRPSVPARVPRRRVTGAFPGPGIPLPGTVRSAFRWI